MNELRKKEKERELGLKLELEASLVEMLQHHHLTTETGMLTEKVKKDAMRSGMRVSDLMVDAVNSQVQECFINEKLIEVELRSLSATISRFHHLTSQCLLASHSLNSALKEFGDFDNWIKVILFDSKTISSAILNIHHPHH